MTRVRRSASFAAALVLALAGGCGGDDDGRDAARVGTSDFQADVPDDWFNAQDVTESEEFRDEVGQIADGAFRNAQFEAVVASRDPVDRFAASVNVVKGLRGLPKSLSASDYEKKARAELEELYRQEPSARPTDSAPPRPTTVADRPAVFTDATRELGGRRVRQRQTFVINDGTAFVITYTALPRDFDDKLPGHDELLESWRWK